MKSPLLEQLVDRLAWDAYLRNCSAPRAAERAWKFWSQCRSVIGGLPVPITIVDGQSLELSWHQEDRYLDMEIGPDPDRPVECLIAFGEKRPVALKVKLDAPSEKFLTALRSFGHA